MNFIIYLIIIFIGAAAAWQGFRGKYYPRYWKICTILIGIGLLLIGAGEYNNYIFLKNTTTANVFNEHDFYYKVGVYIVFGIYLVSAGTIGSLILTIISFCRRYYRFDAKANKSDTRKYIRDGWQKK